MCLYQPQQPNCNSKSHSQLPSLIKENRALFQNINQSEIKIIQTLQHKNHLKDLFKDNKLKQAQKNQSLCISRLHNKQQEQLLLKKKAQYHKLGQYFLVPEKYLNKNKKYYRIDAHIKCKQNIMKNDIQSIIQELVDEKQKNNLLIINLRKKNQINPKKLLCKKPFTASESIAKHKQMLKLNADCCPIKSVNQFTQHSQNQANQQCVKDNSDGRRKTNSNIAKYQTLSKSKETTYPRTIHKDSSLFFTKNSSLIQQIKDLKKILKHYIFKYQQKIQLYETEYEMRSQISNSYFYDKRFQSTNKVEQKSTPAVIENSSNAIFKEFAKLAQQSYDFLQYYLKANYITEFTDSRPLYNYETKAETSNYNKNEIQKVLHSLDKKIILSILKSNCQCLQSEYNQQEIINRIILALRLNPMNEYQFISQEIFTKFKRLLSGECTRKDMREFLLNYFFIEKKDMPQHQFQSVVISIFKKLGKMVSNQIINSLVDKFKKVMKDLMKEIRTKTVKTESSSKMRLSLNGKLNMKSNKDSNVPLRESKEENTYRREEIKEVFASDPLGLWDMILELILIA